jgi:tetratricopeptide (TPR) repeat protein
MKKNIKLFWFIVLLANISYSQSFPNIKVEKDSLGLRNLEIKVEVIGNMATTTYDMIFYNPYDRVLEGELSFPLGQNQSVSRFALDLNGELRESVVVEKEIGRVAFETTIRQNIDPALLEQTKGNNYKARIYPIPAKGTKRVVLSYEQELILNNDSHYFQLPLYFKERLDNFKLEMVVYEQTIKPFIEQGGFENFNFDSWQQSYIAKTSKENYTPNKSLIIKIPIDIEKEKIIASEDYFYIYKVLEPSKKSKRKPKNIELYWDSSYSMRSRDIKTELALLDTFFEYLQNVNVTLIDFSNTVKSKEKFIVKKGDWTQIKLELEDTNYDGGTSYKNILSTNNKTDTYLLFTDGLDNLGKFNNTFKKPVYVVNSLVTSNHNYLDQICTSSGGNYINLNNVSKDQAVNLLKYDTYRFLGTSQTSEKKIEIYPNYIATLKNDFSISGKNFNDGDKVLMHFGYGNVTSETIEYVLNSSNTENEQIKRIWAQKKLSSLIIEKEKNKKLIIDLSKDYQLISPYTSLIVLDRVEDYVRYEITPPKELQEEYNRLVSEHRNDKDSRKEQLRALKEGISEEYEDLSKWWGNKFEFKKETKKGINPTDIENQTQNNNIGNNNSQETNYNISNNISIDHSRPIIKGTVTELEGPPLPGVNIVIKGTSTGTVTDFDGNYALNANIGDIITYNFSGMITIEKTVSSNNIIDLEMTSDENSLEEVVVVGYDSINDQLSGRIAGVQIVQDSEVIESDEVSLNIRGVSSLGANSTPLYIVDGIAVDKKPELDADNIEGIYIVKAEQATALYGSRASSGVVIIKTKQGSEEHFERIQELEERIDDTIELKAWSADSPYLKELNKTKSTEQAYESYLKLRDTYKNLPAFYIDVADFFEKIKESEIAIQILTNIAEIDIDNYELLRAMAYKLEYFKEYEMAIYMYEVILDLRPEDIQSYRDLALSYQEIGEYQKALDLFYKIVNGELLEKDMARRFEGIEAIAFVEMNNLIKKYHEQLNLNAVDKKYIKNTNVDLRVVIDWNHNDTDIDLWIIDPNKEKCSYEHIKTKIGGRLSTDMTEGFGPEEFLLKNAVKGEYKFFIDYYSDEVQKISGPTFLKITIFNNYGNKNESKKTNVYRLDSEDDEIEIGRLEIKK